MRFLGALSFFSPQLSLFWLLESATSALENSHPNKEALIIFLSLSHPSTETEIKRNEERPTKPLGIVGTGLMMVSSGLVQSRKPS